MITFAILILIVAKALPVLNTHISSIHVTRITSIVFLFSGALTLNILNLESIGSGIGIYSGLFQVTTITQLIEIFLFFIGGGILIAWPQKKQYFSFPTVALAASEGTPSLSRGEGPTPGNAGGTDYSLVVLFSSLGSSLLISSYDLISVYLSIELQSFGLYVLSTLYRDSESSTSAGLKYFLLGGLSSCIILLGISLVYINYGNTNIENIYIINNISNIFTIDQTNSIINYVYTGYNAIHYSFTQYMYIQISLVIISIGLFFKISSAPFHN